MTVGEVYYHHFVSHESLGELTPAANRQLHELVRIFTQNVPYPRGLLNSQVVEEFGKLKSDLDRWNASDLFGDNDIWLAAHARTYAWILVTSNVAFDGIPGLRIVDWRVTNTPRPSRGFLRGPTVSDPP
jgi:tRNA(fMet)-specific endonuclease VapC